ncbi:BZ3500_MvSof-1268-A1-R1_Chr10-1g02671 [Microbotryum saponariae]|uniref:phosphoglycerate mutase (2,3-diphosphoglycerate-dependent) n=1 Tax=Microbotryum saponariae TaxID=289078 RepID=A0A2X0LQJ3_9BASI|nr:BZ3500_MvSof-1268-A1-R1_Chr10-1g02671 [Microbotryum saponariae]SDA06160.1 BZ3501_MvSof-1269-A2-R1_Chr10-1g02272 [Microbotryum saponariae]
MRSKPDHVLTSLLADSTGLKHGESEWNKLNLFTGWKNPALTEVGRSEALAGAQALKKGGHSHFDVAFTSVLKRANDTLTIILKEIGQEDLETFKSEKLNERDYGDLTGLNKDDARKKFGEEQVHIWRRSFDVPPPGGESLKLTADRVLPYYESEIKPRLAKGEKVLVAAHGNSLRAMIMALEGLSGEEILKVELSTGVPIVYKLDAEGKVLSKEVLSELNWLASG